MRDMMLDLETWGLTPGCAIRSIGCVMFDPTSREIGYQFYTNVDRASCEAAGLRVEPGTQEWWERQSQVARDSLVKDPVTLKEAARTFAMFFAKCGATRLWSQGANFDEPIWSAAMNAAGQRPPWKFWDSRCTRTIYGAAGLNFNAIRRAGTHHNALDDALHQARCVQRAYEMLELSTNPPVGEVK